MTEAQPQYDPMDLRVGDVLRLRKPHPCGAADWEVTRVGADVGLRCSGCARRILLDRPVLRRRMKAVVSRGEAPDPARLRALYGDVTPDHGADS
jgi:hypothetical protein